MGAAFYTQHIMVCNGKLWPVFRSAVEFFAFSTGRSQRGCGSRAGSSGRFRGRDGALCSICVRTSRVAARSRFGKARGFSASGAKTPTSDLASKGQYALASKGQYALLRKAGELSPVDVESVAAAQPACCPWRSIGDWAAVLRCVQRIGLGEPRRSGGARGPDAWRSD